jgi:hypothetical protein
MAISRTTIAAKRTTMPEPHDWEADPRPLADCLKAWHAARGWTRNRAAAELRAPRSTYDGWCAGRPAGFEGTIRRLMTLLDRAATGRPAESGELTGWRCYHCGEYFTERAEAAAHFGILEAVGQPITDPACRIDLKQFREMEYELERYRIEDSDTDRKMAAMASDHAMALRSAEEEGFARGLAAAKAHPEEIGLYSADTIAALQARVAALTGERG